MHLSHYSFHLSSKQNETKPNPKLIHGISAGVHENTILPGYVWVNCYFYRRIPYQMIYRGIIPSSILPSLIVALHLIFKNWSVQTLAGAHLSQKLYLYEQHCFYVLGCSLFLNYTFKNKRYKLYISLSTSRKLQLKCSVIRETIHIHTNEFDWDVIRFGFIILFLNWGREQGTTFSPINIVLRLHQSITLCHLTAKQNAKFRVWGAS